MVRAATNDLNGSTSQLIDRNENFADYGLNEVGFLTEIELFGGRINWFGVGYRKFNGQYLESFLCDFYQKCWF